MNKKGRYTVKFFCLRPSFYTDKLYEKNQFILLFLYSETVSSTQVLQDFLCRFQK